jgi:hypothetical protein
MELRDAAGTEQPKARGGSAAAAAALGRRAAAALGRPVDRPAHASGRLLPGDRHWPPVLGELARRLDEATGGGENRR